jgi:hypothetical protein
MATNWATRTAETLKRENEKETNDMEQAFKEGLIISTQAGRKWEELCSTISQMAAELTERGTVLQKHKVDPGVNQLIYGFPSKGRHFVLTFDPATLGYAIQHKVYENRSTKVGQPDYEAIFNFVVKADDVLLADAEGCNRNTAEAAEYVLNLLVLGDRGH